MIDPNIALPWYRGADWAEAKRVMADAEGLHETYGEWLLSAEEVERNMRAEGFRTIRVRLEPQAFLAWCAGEGCEPNGPARAKWAAAMAADSSPDNADGPDGV